MSTSTKRPPAWLTTFAASGPIVFGVLLVIIDASQSGWLRSAGESISVHSPMSVNSHGPHGVLMIADFLLFGAALLALAAVARLLLAPGRGRTVAVAGVAALGVGLLLCGFRCDCELFGRQQPSTWHGDLHFAGFSLMLATQPFIALGLWRSLGSRAYAVAGATGIPIYVLLAVEQPGWSWWYAWFLVFVLVPLQALGLRLRAQERGSTAITGITRAPARSW